MSRESGTFPICGWLLGDEALEVQGKFCRIKTAIIQENTISLSCGDNEAVVSLAMYSGMSYNDVLR